MKIFTATLLKTSRGRPMPMGGALPVSVLEARGAPVSEHWEYDAQGVIDNGNALVDGTAGQPC